MPVVLTKKYQRRTENILSEVHERLSRNESHSFIYVAPTKRKIRDLQREFLRIMPAHVAPAFHLFTLETLAAQVYQLTCPPRRLISGPEQAVLIDEAINTVAHRLQYFHLRGSPKRLTRGTLLRIINVINALKESGVYLSALQIEADSADRYEQAKLRDIILIYEKYEQLLGDRFMDSGGLFKQVNEWWDNRAAEEKFFTHFNGVDTIFVSGFDEFADPELTMLNNLSNMERVGMVVSFDYNLENDEVFGHLKENYKKFLEMDFKKNTTTSINENRLQERIAGYLFRSVKINEKLSAVSELSVVAAKDRREEAVIIARIIRHLIREDPALSLDKICVAVFRPDLYTKHFRDIFEQYGIPANITDRFYLDQSPVVVAILSLLMIHQRDFMVSDIMRALSSPYINLNNKDKDLDAGVVHEAACLLKITGGFNNWQKKIDKGIGRVEKKLKEQKGERDISELTREAGLLKETRRILNKLHDCLRIFSEKMTPEDFKHKLLQTIENVNLTECVLNGRFSLRDDEQLEKDTRALEKFFGFIDEFLEILNFEGKRGHAQHLAFYLNRIRESITQVRYNIRQKYGYGIAVTSMDETRGLNFDVMILAGLVDGEFPSVYRPEVFFSSPQRLIREKYHLQEHRYLFYQMLTNFTKHLYITYPKTDGENELVRSSFIDALLDIVSVEYFNGLPPYLSGILYSDMEAVRQIGLNLGNGNHSADELKKISNVAKRENINRYVGTISARMDVELARIGDVSYDEYRGIIGGNLDGSACNALSELRKKTYSVTQLETYGVCPFQYFSERLLNLKVIGEIDEELTPIERGSLLHDVLFEFYIDRRKRGLPPLRETSEIDFKSAFADMEKITRARLTDIDIASPFWEIEQERIFGSAVRKGLLREFLEMERDQQYSVTPSYFEVEFGGSKNKDDRTDPLLSAKDPIDTGMVRLRGKIDRIDTGGSIFRIIDYKVGRSPDYKSIEKGVSLQLPVYLYAIEEMLKRKSGGPWKGLAGIYCVLTPKVKEVVGLGVKSGRQNVFSASSRATHLCDSESELKQIIKRTLGFVDEYVDKIGTGQFPVNPKMQSSSCRLCDFKTICRIQSRALMAPESVADENEIKE